MRANVLAIAIFAAPALTSAQTPTTKLDEVSGIPNVDSKTQAEDIRFKTGADDRLTVPVRLWGIGPFRFLVDTGANRTVISRELAGKLGLEKGDDKVIHTVTGAATVSTANIPSLQVTRNPVKIKDAPLLERANIGADGIIGVDSLRSRRVMFDFEAKNLSIVPSTTPDFDDEPGTIVVRAARRDGHLIVTNAKTDGQKLTVVIDTGSQISIGNEALRQQLIARGLLDPPQTVQLLSVTGALLTGDYTYLRELEIGGVTLKRLAIVFADAHTFRQLKLDRRPAVLLGMNAISAFKKVSIDFANRKFRVVLPETSELDARLAAARLR